MHSSKSFAPRMAAFYAGYLVVQGVQLPFFPVWLAARGFDPWHISICLSLPIALRVLLQPAASAFADHVPNRRIAICIFTTSAALLFAPLWLFREFVPILLLFGSSWVAWSFAFPAAEALALTGVRRFGLDYGRMRISGSVSFMLANLGAGTILGLFSPEGIYWLILVLLVVSLIVSLTLPGVPTAKGLPPTGSPPASLSARAILGHPAFLAAMIAGALIQASHTMLYNFGTLYWRGLGFSGVEIGGLWATGVLAEMILLFHSGAAWRRLGGWGLLTLGGAAAMVRWSLFPLQPGFLGYLPLQAMHALTFCATMLGVQRLIVTRAPEEITGSAQGLNNMAMSLATLAGTFTAGPLYGALGAYAFAVMTIPAAVAVAILAACRSGLSDAARPAPGPG